MQYNQLKEGYYTKSSKIVKQLVLNLKNKAGNKPFINVVNDYIASLEDRQNAPNKMDFFRKRTATEIIKSGFQMGCSDRAIAFIAIMREVKIPAIFVETFKKKFLNTEHAGTRGHVFTNIYHEDRWHIFEPKSAFKDKYELGGGGEFLPVAMGLDFSVLYTINKNKLALIPKEFSDIESLKALVKICNKDVEHITFGDFSNQIGR